MKKILLLIQFLSISNFSFFAAETSKQKPLFPVSIDHEFPNAEESFNEVLDLILSKYYTTSLSEKDLYWAAILGMLQKISPPEHSDLGKIWTPQDYDKVFNSLNGVSVSIGIKSSYNAADGSLTITEVLDGSPAESILLISDRILRIDGSSLKNQNVNDINKMLQGEPGTDVTLTIVRDIKVFDITIARKEFKEKNLIVSLLPTENIAVVEIKKIVANIADELKEELIKLREGNVKNLILDFRNNPGGIFLESLKIAELFLPEKHVLLRTLRRSDTPQNYVSSNRDPFKFGIVIIVNEKTASSCEIIAATLHDNNMAKLIGTKTYGKAVFETTYRLKNDYRIKFISGAMFSPLGKSWQSKGLTPDFLVNQNQKRFLTLSKLKIENRIKNDSCIKAALKIFSK